MRGLIHLVVNRAVARCSHRLRLMVARLLELLFELGSLARLFTCSIQVVDRIVVAACI